MKTFPLLFLLPLTLAACVAPVVVGGLAVSPSLVSPAIETAHEVHDSSEQDELRIKARSGDRVAQYELGESYCCRVGGPLDRVSVYDNDKATEWYCRAAHQDYVPAQIRLAKLYSGHPIHGFRLVQHASALMGDEPTDMSLALMWANVAAAHGDEKAIAAKDEIRAKATPEQIARADALTADWRTAPCRWSAVYPHVKAGGDTVHR